jgi:2-phosphosulfolactate phosphatase
MTAKPPIQVSVSFAPWQLDEMSLNDKNIVVIDVLRASTTIAMALQNGAKEIIPVSSIDSAVKISSSLFGDVTLRGGERNGKMIEGFNLGNSPQEYTREAVDGKTIIFLTTNGSAAMVKGRYAKNQLVAAFVNLTSVVNYLVALESDFLLICAGQDNRFCLEDAVCAGKIIAAYERATGAEVAPDDSALAAIALEKTYGKSILKLLKQSAHGRYLTDIGFADDLKTCAEVDTIPVLPLLAGNVIRASKENPKL